jgi:ankyrin repeat protein
MVRKRKVGELFTTDSAQRARELLDQGHDPRKMNQAGMTPLHTNSNMEVARVLIESDEMLLDIADARRRFPVQTHTPAVAQLFIEMGAELPDELTGRESIPLMRLLIATGCLDLGIGLHNMNRDLDYFRFLIANGADVNQDIDGISPLEKAITKRRPELVMVLLEAGARCDLSLSWIYEEDEDELAPLSIISCRGHSTSEMSTKKRRELAALRTVAGGPGVPWCMPARVFKKYFLRRGQDVTSRGNMMKMEIWL